MYFNIFQYQTDLIPIIKQPVNTGRPSFVYMMPDDENPKGRMVLLELTPPPDIEYKTRPGSSQQMNVLGIVIFSATMGKAYAYLVHIYIYFSKMTKHKNNDFSFRSFTG